MSRVNRKLQLVILLVLVCLIGTMSIAYAVLSTTLNINGTAQVQDASWNVHFDNVQVNPYSVEINPVITDNNKVSFSADLTTPGDFYKFTVDIVNEGSIDAMIESIAKVPELTVEQKKYLRYEIEYVDGTSINESQLLKSGETKTISILFSYCNDIPISNLPTTDSEFDLEIVLVYIQADSTGAEISGNEKIVKVVSGDLNTVGSEICIGEECFYLMKNDGYTVTMLAKYNLYVGAQYELDTSVRTVYGDEATGIQDETMIGFESDASKTIFNGVISFSSSGSYWENEQILYPAYVYNSNSRLYSYVENYKFYLETLGVFIENARVIKIEELKEFGCDLNVSSCINAPSWLYLTSYWTGSASDGSNVWRLFSTGYIDSRRYDRYDEIGLRPVIEIPLTEF